VTDRPAGFGPPSERTAVVVRAQLPAGLERLRRRHATDAADGMFAHATMLWPFVAPERLERSVREELARVAQAHAPIPYRLTRVARWPDTVYVAVDPEAPFVRLQAALEAAFPGFPVYGPNRPFEFIPHVTIAEGAAVDDPRVLAEARRIPLPRRDRAAAIEVIARSASDRWRTVWRIRLAGSPTGKMRP
jgi:2'-5' RNA ligase